LQTIRNIAFSPAPAGSAARRPTSQDGGSCADHDVRCACGSLLARIVAGAVELKCRKCKQTWRVPLESD
jgi:hypothetical protein